MTCSRQAILEYLAQSKDIFSRDFSVKRVGLFGSYARGDNDPASDIDIVVELEQPDMFALIGIKQAVEEAFAAKVDIVRLRKDMNPFLKNRIERDAVYV